MKSYLKFLSRNKLYTAVEAVGLVVSLAMIILTSGYVVQQWKVTRSNQDWKRVYIPTCKGMDEGQWRFGYNYELSSSLGDAIPEVESSALYQRSPLQGRVKVDDEPFLVNTCCVGGDFFGIFPFSFIEGSPDVLEDKSNVLVSRNFARKLGGGKPVVGRGIDGGYRIGGIIEDFDGTIFPPVDILYNIRSQDALVSNKWRMDTYPFLKLREGVDRQSVNEKLDTTTSRYFTSIGLGMLNSSKEPNRLVRYDEIFFSDIEYSRLSSGNLSYLKIISAITLLLLISAIFNYINLNVALSGKRMKEMATRRILGASGGSIFRRFLIESVGFTSIAFLLGYFLALTFLQTFNRLLDGDVPVSLNPSAAGIMLSVVFILLASFLQGLLPAVAGSSFSPISVVKGEFRAKRKHSLSKAFICIQNAFSILMLCLSIVMFLQMRHLRSLPLGADVEGDFYFHATERGFYDSFEDKLKSLPEVSRVGRSVYYPGCFEDVYIESSDGKNFHSAVLNCDSIAFDIFGFDVYYKFEEPLPGTVWLSDADLDKYSANAPVKRERLTGTDLSRLGLMGERIGGMLRDYAGVGVLRYDPSIRCHVAIKTRDKLPGGGLVIETTGDREKAAKAIMDEYSRISQDRYGLYMEPFRAGFIRDLLDDELMADRHRMSLIVILMGICVLLSVLGMVAMSTYYTDESGKDIAIRKVFGDTVSGEVRRMLISYLILVLVAALVAIPVAVALCRRILEGYSYRISGYGWVFAVGTLLAILTAFASVLWQTLRAARTNPATELKKE